MKKGTKMIRTKALFVVCVLFVFAGGALCDSSSNEKICEPGLLTRCPCLEGGEGLQTCSDDGTRWGECVGCPAGDQDTETIAEGVDSVDDLDTAEDQTDVVDVEEIQEEISEGEAQPEVELEERTCEGPESFIVSLALAGSECCFDFNGDEISDNTLYDFLESQAAIYDIDLVSRYNNELATWIQQALLVKLLEFADAGLFDTDTSFGLHVFDCLDADQDFSDNLDPATQADFLVLPYSVVGDRCSPPVSDPDAQLAIDQGAASFAASLPKMYLPIPLMVGDSDAGAIRVTEVMDVKMTGDITVAGETGAFKVTIANGRLGGAIPMKAFFEGINDYVANHCECLGLGGDSLFTVNADGSVDCADASVAACESTADTEGCGDIGSNCTINASILPMLMDVDTDNDEQNDAMSFGMTFTAIPALITGVAE